MKRKRDMNNPPDFDKIQKTLGVEWQTRPPKGAPDDSTHNGSTKDSDPTAK
jgi:hypothetical protein